MLPGVSFVRLQVLGRAEAPVRLAVLYQPLRFTVVKLQPFRLYDYSLGSSDMIEGSIFW